MGVDEGSVNYVTFHAMPQSVAELSASKSHSMDASCQSSDLSPNESLLTLPTFAGEMASPRNTVGIRIENYSSKRSKDLIRDVGRTTNLFDSVYNNVGVKKAHVRKWSSEIAKRVKSKECEIWCSIWDDFKGAPWHTFSIEELKRTSTRQLVEIAPEGDMIKLVLQCVERHPGEENMFGEQLPRDSNDTKQRPRSASGTDSDNNVREKAMLSGERMPDLKCPFSGVEITSEQLEDFKDHISTHNSADSLTAASLPSRARDAANLGFSRRNSNFSMRASSSNHRHGSSHASLSATLYSDDTLAESFAEDTMNLERKSTGSMAKLGDSQSSSAQNDATQSRARTELKSTMRIRLINQVTTRFKDLTVDISKNRNLFEDVYCCQDVRDARVRKWGSEMASRIKAGKVEIVAAVWDDESDTAWRTFRIHELKGISTRDLYILTPGSWESVKIYLLCSDVDSKGVASLPIVSSDGSIGLTSSKSETFLRAFGSNRKPSRLNHMNLTSKRNAVFRNSKPPAGGIGSLSIHGTPSFSSASLKRILSSSGIDEAHSNNKTEVDRDRGRRIADSENCNRQYASLDIDDLITSRRRKAWRHKSSQEADTAFNEVWNEVLEEEQPDLGQKRDMKRTMVARVETFLDHASTPFGVDDKNRQDDPLATPTVKDFLRLCNAKNTTELQSTGSLRDRRPHSKTVRAIDASGNVDAPMFKGKKQGTEVSDKIDRFLRPPKRFQTPGTDNGDASSNAIRNGPTANVNAVVSRDSSARRNGGVDVHAPPVTEISLIKDDSNCMSRNSLPPSSGVGLSPEVVKEVFPYHVVLDSNFQILQVGNLLSQLLNCQVFANQCIHEIFMVKSPIPMMAKWDWYLLDKMKDQTIYLESVTKNRAGERAKIKGTIIEISSSPRRVMLALFPNVKNLSELESMNLSMADLPLHSCQREAVLLGEHSKSEVNLTNHLDQLHRDLINSMEKQIEDRTNELESANQNLEQANAQLAIQSSRQLEHFACMSHEIRTPLNCIVGMSSLLLDEVQQMDPMHADSVKMIYTSGELLKAVVDDVLDYAKLESGSFEVDIKPTVLQDTLNSIVHSISQKVQDKNIRLRTHFSVNLPQIFETDSRRLQQVLFNLLGNAGKFSKQNSVIDLSVEILPGRLETDSPMLCDHFLRFSVTDYGKGIDKKDFKKIFEPFSQASKETQTVYGGTGLGLSITSKLVHRLGGSISLNSEIGQFTEFIVDLPFVGDLVDVQSMKQAFSGMTLCVVEPSAQQQMKIRNKYIKSEPMSLSDAVQKAYDLDVLRYDSVDVMSSQLMNNEAANGKELLILLQEELVNSSAITCLKGLVKDSYHTLMTFGPHYKVNSTKEHHVKSLVGMIPSSLLSTIFKERGNMLLSKDLGLIAQNRTDIAVVASSLTIDSPQTVDPSGNDATFRIENKRGVGSAPEKVQSEAQTNPLSRREGVELEPSSRRILDDVNLNKSETSGSTSNTSSRTSNRSALSNDATKSGDHGLFAALSMPNTTAVEKDAIPQLEPTNAVELPATPDTKQPSKKREGQSSQQSKTEGSKHGHLKVLYAEDNIVNQKVLSRVLNRAGVSDITVVDNGKKAVDLAATTAFDFIFMDMQMPVMGGMEACQLIIERNPDAVVIFVTAHALHEFKAQAEAVGATDFISKPFRLNDIKTVLETLNLPGQ